MVNFLFFLACEADLLAELAARRKRGEGSYLTGDPASQGRRGRERFISELPQFREKKEEEKTGAGEGTAQTLLFIFPRRPSHDPRETCCCLLLPASVGAVWLSF